MALWGTKKLQNNAPKFAVGGGLGISANGVSANGIVANGMNLFANTLANAFHSNISIGCFAVSNKEKLVSVDTSLNPGSGYNINDLLTLTNTGAVGANADLTVVRLSVTTAVLSQTLGGTGYANGDIISVSGTGTKANLSVNVGNTIVGNVKTVSILANGSYSANFAALTNVATSNVTGIGSGAFVNVTAGIAQANINNSGAYGTRPTTTALNVLVGGSGTLANANLTFSTNHKRPGGAGWVMKTVQQPSGQTQYEVLVACGTMDETGGPADTGVF